MPRWALRDERRLPRWHLHEGLRLRRGLPERLGVRLGLERNLPAEVRRARGLLVLRLAVDVQRRERARVERGKGDSV